MTKTIEAFEHELEAAKRMLVESGRQIPEKADSKGDDVISGEFALPYSTLPKPRTETWAVAKKYA